MQKNARRLSGRIVAFGVSAAIMFSGMTMDIQAKESTGLPSAGIDFYLASVTSNWSSIGTRPKTVASKDGSSRTFKVVVVTVAILVPTSFASATASSPVTQYSAFTNPVTEPEVISYQPSCSEINSPTDLSYNLPRISPSSLGILRTFT